MDLLGIMAHAKLSKCVIAVWSLKALCGIDDELPPDVFDDAAVVVVVEFVELPGHSFFVGTQAHPEFKSRPDRPHPLFLGLIIAAAARAEGREPHIIDPESVDASL